MQIKGTEIKVACYEQATFNYQNKSSNKPSKIETCLEISDKEVERIKTYFNKLKNTEDLVDGEKVYFSKSVTFPRETFRTNFPKNPIKRSPENADVIIVDLKQFLANIGRLEYMYIDYHSPTDTVTKEYRMMTDNNPRYKYIRKIDQREIDEVNNILTKKIIFVETLQKKATKESLELDEALISNMKRMLDSKLKEDVEIALNMLTNVSYEKSKEEIAWLLSTTEWVNKRPRRNVNVKTLLECIEKDFPSYLMRDPRYVSMMMGKKYQDTDPKKAKLFFSEFIEGYLEENEDFELKIIKK